jgi:aspartyl-tRNA(Asn)/glutamyl-tRNA(Gln) amidotransferase subunit A
VLDLSVTELSAALAGKQVSSVELTRAFLARIGKLKDLNAFITVDEAGALQRAAQADARRARGAAAPLTGVPFAHKDIYCTEGVRRIGVGQSSRKTKFCHFGAVLGLGKSGLMGRGSSR